MRINSKRNRISLDIVVLHFSVYQMSLTKKQHAVEVLDRVGELVRDLEESVCVESENVETVCNKCVEKKMSEIESLLYNVERALNSNCEKQSEHKTFRFPFWY